MLTPTLTRFWEMWLEPGGGRLQPLKLVVRKEFFLSGGRLAPTAGKALEGLQPSPHPFVRPPAWRCPCCRRHETSESPLGM